MNTDEFKIKSYISFKSTFVYVVNVIKSIISSNIIK